MRVLFIDDQLPGHFRHLPGYLAARGHDVVFGYQVRKAETWPGVRSVEFGLVRPPSAGTHRLLRKLEGAVLGGQMVYRLCHILAGESWYPDVIYGFSGWGPTLFLRDAFPRARVVVYNDWYYWPREGVYDFFPGRVPSMARATRIHTGNATNLLDLADSDHVVCTTRWQLSTFPVSLWSKMSVIHDGIDTDFFAPGPSEGFRNDTVDLRGVPELVTYVTRGMEPYRGFEQFLRALVVLQQRRPEMHAVIGGVDDVFYSWRPADGRTWKQLLLAELDLDLRRVHFTGALPLTELMALLRASDAHVYLTAPFLPSWSLFEALATGCLVVCSDTEPVLEVVDDGVEGLVVDFFDVEALAGRIEEALVDKARFAPMRARARERIVARYGLHRMMARQEKMLSDVHAGLPAEQIEGSAARAQASGRAIEVPW